MAIRRTTPNGVNLRCDCCGQPATWRTRVIPTCCMLGEALCDRCESKSSHSQWWRRNDNFWAELAGDAAWLTEYVTAGLNKLKERIKPNILRL